MEDVLTEHNEEAKLRLVLFLSNKKPFSNLANGPDKASQERKAKNGSVFVWNFTS